MTKRELVTGILRVLAITMVVRGMMQLLNLLNMIHFPIFFVSGVLIPVVSGLLLWGLARCIAGYVPPGGEETVVWPNATIAGLVTAGATLIGVLVIAGSLPMVVFNFFWNFGYWSYMFGHVGFATGVTIGIGVLIILLARRLGRLAGG